MNINSEVTYNALEGIASEESLARLARDGIKVVAESFVATDTTDLVVLVLTNACGVV